MVLFDNKLTSVFRSPGGVSWTRAGRWPGRRWCGYLSWGWRNRSYHHTTSTDGEGRFYFPPVTKSTLLAALLPYEPVIIQEIFIR